MAHRSTVHDDFQGTGFWADIYDGRAVIGPGYNDYMAGVPEEENIRRYKAAAAAGDQSRLTAWW